MIESILPGEVEGSRGHNPPLGLLYLAAAVRNVGLDEVAALDAQAEELDDQAIENRLRSLKPDVVGVTALSFTLIDALAVARIAKKLGAKTVLGGPHPHIYPKETSAFEQVDYVMRGEGEKSFTQLLNALREEKRPVNIPGAGWHENGAYQSGPELTGFLDAKAFPIPARDLVNTKLYTSILARTSPVTTIMSSRGCPYRCLFCDRPHLGRKFRAREAKSVADEIGECIELGIREFIFYDDNFTTDRERVLAICAEIRARGYRIIFDVRARVNDLDEEMLTAMRAAGCDRIHLGVESGDEEILKTLRKGITRAGAERGFRLARNAGLRTLAYFMFGAPGETRETAARTVEFARRLKPDYAHFSMLIPFPATELYTLGLERGIWKTDVWAEYARNPSSGFIPPVWEENLDRAELLKITLDAYKKFYWDPAYVLRRLSHVRSINEFLREARAGMKIFKL